jgi:hypothetical protein
MKNLTLDDNPGLSGSIPKSIGALVSLERLRLARCSLEGSIPTSLRNLALLSVLDVSDNKISGPFPSDALAGMPASPPNMTSLVELRVAGNNLTGALTIGFAGFAQRHGGRLATADFRGPPGLERGNALLTGPLPPLLEAWELADASIGTARLQTWFETFESDLRAAEAAERAARAEREAALAAERAEREERAAAVMKSGGWNTG